ncbi:MAG: DUF6922 domain-containing protein, partial [Kiritimatiellia bacterium]
MGVVNIAEELPRSLFWDVDPAKVDPERHAVFIISRVMDRGDRPEVDKIFAYYGAERVKEALLAAPHLDKRTMAYFANYFGVELSAFRAYRRVVYDAAWVSSACLSNSS